MYPLFESEHRTQKSRHVDELGSFLRDLYKVVIKESVKLDLAGWPGKEDTMVVPRKILPKILPTTILVAMSHIFWRMAMRRAKYLASARTSIK